MRESVPGAATAALDYDEGLRRYMLGVYNHMGLGLAVSGIISFIIGSDPTLSQLVWQGPQSWVFLLSPLAVVLVI